MICCSSETAERHQQWSTAVASGGASDTCSTAFHPCDAPRRRWKAVDDEDVRRRRRPGRADRPVHCFRSGMGQEETSRNPSSHYCRAPSSPALATMMADHFRPFEQASEALPGATAVEHCRSLSAPFPMSSRSFPAVPGIQQNAYTHGDDVIRDTQIEIAHASDKKVSDDKVRETPEDVDGGG
jgi:hypothetical protein